MDFRELLQSAFVSLQSNKMRTFLTMLGIIIGISSVILIYSIGKGAVAFVNNELSFFGTNFFQINPGSSAMASFTGGAETITLEDVKAIRDESGITNIKSVGAFATTSTIVSANDKDKSMLVYGMTPEIADMLKPIMASGEFLSNDHDINAERVAVIGQKAVETFFGSNMAPVGEKLRIDNKPFTVIGVANSGSSLFGSFFDNAIFIPLNTARDEITGSSHIREVDIAVYDTELMNETINQVTDFLRDRHNLQEGEENDFIVASATDALSIVETVTTMLTLIIVAISAISLVVGGVGVMNIMLVAITERTREVGLLKAMGALDSDILWQFLIEAMVMTGVGGILGILFGALGAAGVALAVGIPLVISPLAVFAAFSVSMLVGIVFGLYPARRAAHLSPIEALRYE
jgi:putative ABC transport system permease protein